MTRLSDDASQEKASRSVSAYAASPRLESPGTHLLLIALCYVIPVSLLWSSAQEAIAGPEAQYLLAEQLKLDGRYEDATLVYANIAEEIGEGPVAEKLDGLIEELLWELSKVEAGTERLKTFAAEYRNHRVAAKALFALATKYNLSPQGCRESLPLYERILENYPDTPEAFRAAVDKAVVCLVERAEDNLAIADLKAVAQRAGKSPIRAYALYQLGVLYQWREDRNQARATFELLKQEYPINFEFPRPGGLRLVQAAVVSQQQLNRYRLSPLLDKIMFHVRRRCGFEVKPSGMVDMRGGTVVQAVTVFVTRAMSLLLIVASLVLLRTTGIARVQEGIPIFERPWSLARSWIFLVGIWLIEPLYYTLAYLVERGAPVGWGGVDFIWSNARFSTFGMIGVMLAGPLWRESLAKIFGLRWRLVWRSMLAITGLCGAYLILSRTAVLLLSGKSGFPIVLRDTTAGSDAGAGAAAVLIMGITAKATAEECVYRGIVFETFRRLSGRASGAVLSAMLFAMSHAAPIGATLGFVIFGVIAVYLREQFRSLLPSVILHVIVNCVASVR